MKVSKYLESIVKSLEGSLIGIGFNDPKLSTYIDKNKKIIECYLLDCEAEDDEDGKVSKIRIGKLRKKFKKHKPDYIIYNIESIKDYKDKFVYDSLYLANKEIYLYNENSEIDITAIKRRYKRYAKIKTVKCSNGEILIIKQTKKLTKINEFYNKNKDNLISTGDFISSLLSDS